MKVDLKEKTRLLNEFRQSHKGQTMTNGELRTELRKVVGKDERIVGALLKSFPSEKIGNKKLHEIPTDPIHIGIVRKAYESRNSYARKHFRDKNPEKPLFSEEEALKLLESTGKYRIQHIVGFDMDTFQKENPDMYQKYVIYGQQRNYSFRCYSVSTKV